MTIKPNFVVIGAQKAASTYLMQMLAEHPEIFVFPRELPYFEDPDYGERTFEKFCERFIAAEGKKAVGFKRPSYLAKAECAERIYRHLPTAKLIAVYRNPIERSVSAYFHYMRGGRIPVRPLNQGMTDILDRRYEGAYPASAEIIEYGFYSKHLRRYLRFFPAESILSVIFDDIVRTPAAVIRSMYRFLDVAEDFQPRAEGRRPMATIRSLARLRMVNLIRGVTTYHNEDRTRVYRRKSIFAGAVRKAYLAFDKTILAKLFPDPRIALAPLLHNRLVEIYSEDVRQLEKLLDKELEDRWLGRNHSK